MVQHLFQELQHGREHTFPRREKTILNKIGVKAGRLDLAFEPDERSEGRAVQIVEAHGDAADVRIALRPAQQHTGQQRVQRGLARAVRPQKVHAEAGRLEFIRLHGVQTHTRHDRELMQHKNHPFFSAYYTSFFGKGKKNLPPRGREKYALVIPGKIL